MRNLNILPACIFLLLVFGQIQAQTYFSEDFENGISGWTLADNNGGPNWVATDPSQFTDEFGSMALASNSQVVPDNLAISPAIDLTAVTTDANNQLYLDYQVMSLQGFAQEKYSVYATTSKVTSEILNSTPVFTETLQVGGSPQSRRINLSDFAGETIYITFRHHDCNQFIFFLDNIFLRKQQTNNITLNSVDLERFVLPNQQTVLSVNIKNSGINVINSIELNWSDGVNNHSNTIPLNLQSGESQTIQHPVSVVYSDVREANISVTVAQVNGGQDSDNADNSLQTKFNTISQSANTKVFVEEATGTWCGYCPRGEVAVANAYEDYPNKFIGVAVHTHGSPDDPMTINEYYDRSDFFTAPSMHIDRTLFDQPLDPATINNFVDLRVDRLNPVYIDIVPQVNGNEMTIQANVTFYSNFTGANYRLATIIVENNVQNDDPSYAQANYYSEGGEPMGGYENLPHPVPADQMIHKHVARALLGGYDGQEGSVPQTINNGQTISYTFNYTIPDTFVTENLIVVVLLLDNNSGQVINAEEIALSELSTTEIQSTGGFSIYPNPAKDNVNLKIMESGDFTVNIYDLSGKKIYKNSLGNVQANNAVSVPLKVLSKGIYILSLEGKNKSYSKRLIIK